MTLSSRQQQSGFTLVELITVIVISGILGVMLVGFITKPIDAYMDVTRRAQLVDNADMALRQMQRDVRRALPNSILTQNDSVTMINSVAGGRYRTASPGDFLDFTDMDTSFDSIGFVSPIDSSASLRLVIYNLGVAGANAYLGDPVITPSGASINSDGRVTFPAHQFPFASPQQRFFLVDHAIRYRCTGNRLLREQCNISDLSSCSVSEPIATDVNCALTQFTYNAGTATRTGVVQINIALERDNERIRLLHQIHVDNTP